MPLISTLTLGADHSMVVNNLPRGLSGHRFGEKYPMAQKLTKASVEKFGLFSSDIDYNTYFPDVTPEQFTPEKDEFIEPVFRLLSSCIVSKNYMPTEFPADVLKASMPLMVGQTVNCDHETNIGNAIGTVKEVFWQEAYTVDGQEIPAGMNGVLKIDGKANPRIARGINMDPPSIHSNSVTVQFEWKPSHNFEDPYEFWDKIGTYDDKGEMVRRIATKIISYKETSLVSHGADPFAQKVDQNNHIVNPGYASSVYNSFSEEVKQKISTRVIPHYDFKSFGEVAVMYNTSKTPIEGTTYQEDPKSNNTNKTSTTMNKELQEFLELLFGENMLSLAEGTTASTEIALSAVKAMIQENKDLQESKTTAENSVQSLKDEVAQLKKTANENASFIEIGQNHFKETKEAALSSYRKLVGEGKEDANIIALIESLDSISSIKSLKASYDAQLEEKFPLQCADCGSKNVNRASSVTTQNNEDDHNKIRTTADVLDTLAEKKR